ncbi:MAG: hypothetical protein EBY30_17930, partial [Rhodospirillales bacterium]|nr:hypothetical protein [Rhodospirillales bacterium]
GADRYGERFWQRLRTEIADAPLLAGDIPSAGNIANPSPPFQAEAPSSPVRVRGWLAPRSGWLR